MRLLRTVLTRPEGSTQRDKMKPGFRGRKKETHGGQDGTRERASCPRGSRLLAEIPVLISIVPVLHLKVPILSTPIHLVAQIGNLGLFLLLHAHLSPSLYHTNL